MTTLNDAPAGQQSVLTLANLLTVARLIFLPLIIIGVVTHHGYLAAGGMLLAVVSDLLDGRVARRMRQQSSFGATLDSTVDFIFIYALFIALYAAGRMATYQFVVIYAAMLLTGLLQGSAMIARGNGTIMRTRFGKPAGALQYAYLLFLMACEVLPHAAWHAPVNQGIFLVLAAAILCSGVECVTMLIRLCTPSAPHAPVTPDERRVSISDS